MWEKGYGYSYDGGFTQKKCDYQNENYYKYYSPNMQYYGSMDWFNQAAKAIIGFLIHPMDKTEHQVIINKLKLVVGSFF